MILTGPYADAVCSRREELAVLAQESSRGGQISSEAIDILRGTGLMDALKPKMYGGHGAIPTDFFCGVVALSAELPALGWIAGVLGVHAYEIALTNHRACEEVWATSRRDNWVASPFSQSGRAIPIDGGYLLSGKWEFSSGFGLADWLCIGGKIVNKDGSLTGANFCLLRDKAVEIEHSWDVIGLQGTGSVSFQLSDAFVPTFMTYDPQNAIDGSAWRSMGYEEPVFRMPRQTMLSSAISASTLGAGLGLVQSVIAMTTHRLKGSSHRPASRDPHILRSIAEAQADIEAGIVQMVFDLDQTFRSVCSLESVKHSDRLRIKRNLVRSVHRAGQSISELFSHSGGGALRSSSVVQYYWREFQAGRNHNSHIHDWYTRYGLELFGFDSEGGVV